MTPDRFREVLALLDLPQRGFARLLNRPEGTVRQWARGTVVIPADVAAWLEAFAAFMTAHPLPARPIQDKQSLIQCSCNVLKASPSSMRS